MDKAKRESKIEPMKKLILLLTLAVSIACQKEDDKPTFCTCELYSYQFVTTFNPLTQQWVLQNVQPYSTNCQDNGTSWQEGVKRYEVKCVEQ